MQDNDIFVFFAKYIEKELGIIYSEHNYFQLQNRLEEISKLLGVSSLNDLYLLAQKGITGQFKQLLLDLATNNETSFFRDPKIFKAIEQNLLKNNSDNKKLNIWSAANSTGQEALSISMMIKEYNEKNNTQFDFFINGTDISDRVLQKAKLGVYSQLEVQRGLPAAYMIKYFKKDEQDRWKVSPQLLKHIEYSKQNLKEKFNFFNQFDLVLCRNVLIYQNVESKKEIISRIEATLKPNGLFILGSGESLMGLSDSFDLLNNDGAVVYVKKNTVTKVA